MARKFISLVALPEENDSPTIEPVGYSINSPPATSAVSELARGRERRGGVNYELEGSSAPAAFRATRGLWVCHSSGTGPDCQRATERCQPSARHRVQLVSGGLREPRVNQR